GGGRGGKGALVRVNDLLYGHTRTLAVPLHGLDERSKRRCYLAATRIVEMKTWEARAPVIEHGFQRTVREMRRHLRLECKADHFAGQHGEHGDAGVVFEERARHRNLTLTARLLQLPPICFAPGPEVHDAPVREQ